MATKKESAIGMIYYDDVVIEKQDVNLRFGEKTPVTLGFDPSKVIGTAQIFPEDGVLKAAIVIHQKPEQDLDLLYPAIGFKVDKQQWKSTVGSEMQVGTIFQLGLTSAKNVDESILPLGEQLN